MEAAPPLVETESAPPRSLTPALLQRREEYIVAALKAAIAEPKEHRLFQSGKLAGLFPTRNGVSSEAALEAIKLGLLECVRTETRGKFIIEWVRPTPRGVQYVHDRDSPKAVLQELKDLLAASRSGVPTWLAETREELDAISARFEDRTRAVIGKLENLGRRLDAALLRVEAQGFDVPAAISQLVPWAVDALEYLDLRSLAGAPNPCPLSELFNTLRDRRPGISISEFHNGLRRLHDNHAIRLTAQPGRAADAEYALLVGQELCSFIER